jgi:hypothetical protein
VYAQAVADEVGPRVTVTADFQGPGGNRQVDARFHMYDDGYVIVGHLDAAGRLKVVFPSQPGDDGFVRGDKVYTVPSFFAGFNDEYQWRYQDYRYQTHAIASRRDSYDAGMAYVFVIASWRPMRLDRIADGNKWATYEVADISYMSDPREAVEELAATIAGDNREAYTIEYARYSTTNYGTYAFSDFDAVNSGCGNYTPALGFSFSRFFNSFSPYSAFTSGCSSAYSPFVYGFPYTYGSGSGYTGIGFYPGVPGRVGPPAIPGLHLPRVDGGPGAVAMHGAGAASPAAPGSQYRRPGLVVEDATGRRAPGERQTAGNELGFTSSGRPTIQQMVGAHRADDQGRGRVFAHEGMTRDPSWSNRGAARTDDSRARFGNGGSAQGTSGRAYGGSSHPATARGESHGEATRNTPSHGESTRSAPSRVGGESSSHAAPAHSEPAARSAPPAASSSGSSGSKKP